MENLTKENLVEVAGRANLDRYTLNDLLLCAEEELSISVKFYPGMVARGKMSAHLALDKVGKKRAICELLESMIVKVGAPAEPV